MECEEVDMAPNKEQIEKMTKLLNLMIQIDRNSGETHQYKCRDGILRNSFEINAWIVGASKGHYYWNDIFSYCNEIWKAAQMRNRAK
jgi:hypothetical protein